MKRLAFLTTTIVGILIFPMAATLAAPLRGPGGELAQSGRQQSDLPEERPSTTGHVVAIGGGVLKYHATTGRLPVLNDDDRSQAKMFYVAYTRDGGVARNRPVTFLFNGGPGSSSIYLHMGSFGPVRIMPPKPGSESTAKSGVVPNPSTLLDATDLVFIDMVGTGYSRLEQGVNGDQFWSVDKDAESFSKFIRSWLKANGRELSPKYLFGESYGTIRAAALANQLQSNGVSLNGVMLTGAVLNLGLLFGSGYDQSFVSYLPSIAAVAWYHAKTATRAPNLSSFLDEARAFASGPYREALSKGHDLPPEEARAVATRYAALTGLPVNYVMAANLRVDPGNFRKELLRSDGKVLGRFDARFTGSDSSGIGSVPEDDPSNATVERILTASLQSYLLNDLKYEPPLTYRFGIQSMPGFDFDFKHQPPIGPPQLFPDAAVDLAQAMRSNRGLKVVFLSGYYDLATPFGAAEFDSTHMLLPLDRRRNLSMRYYASGHMLYLDDDVMPKLHEDLANFVRDAM